MQGPSIMPLHSRISLVILVSLLLGLPACKRTSNNSGPVEREGEPPIFRVDDDDPAMKQAIGEASSTSDVFVKHLQKPAAEQSYFSVKGSFTDGKHTEHMWLSDVSFKDGEFHGKIGNEPNNLSKPKLGDSVKFAKGEISDWMIIEGGELRGG